MKTNALYGVVLLLIPTIAFASPPVRQFQYSPNTIIASSDVTANEDVMFNYLQAGVDTIADGTIRNVDIASDANIQAEKLNLTSVTQNIVNTGTIANTGTFTNTGNATITGNLIVTGSITAGSLNLLPAGTILMWNSTVATIPSGWVLCDGTNSTPDLRDKFIVGAKQDSAGAAKTNLTGSLTQSGGSTTISQANLPSFNMTTPLGARTNASNGTDAASVSNSSGGTNNTINLTTPSGGSGTAYTQPYFSLCFIQRT